MVSLNKNTQLMLAIGGIGIAFYLAWDNNFLGIRDLIDGLAYETEEALSQQSPSRPTALDDFSYYSIRGAGSSPVTTHTRQYPFPYPYPPTTYPKTHAPTTLPAAHYQLAGTPNIRQIPGTTTIMSPPPAYMANPSLWFDKGGIVGPRSIINPGMIDYGPYRFDAPQFSPYRYVLRGTNLDYPFILGPLCPQGQYYNAGRCWFSNNPYPSTL